MERWKSGLFGASYWNVTSGMLLSRPPLLVPPLPLAPLLLVSPLDAPEELRPLLPPDDVEVAGNGSLPSLPQPLAVVRPTTHPVIPTMAARPQRRAFMMLLG